MTELLFKDESYKIIGACFEVYNELGSGFLENVYQECLELELPTRQIPNVVQQQLRLSYKTKTLKSVYVPDFICYRKMIDLAMGLKPSPLGESF